MLAIFSAISQHYSIVIFNFLCPVWKYFYLYDIGIIFLFGSEAFLAISLNF